MYITYLLREKFLNLQAGELQAGLNKIKSKNAATPTDLHPDCYLGDGCWVCSTGEL